MSRPDPGYCLHKPTGRAYVNLGGRVVYLGIFGTDESRQRYTVELAAWRDQGRPRKPKASAILTIEQLLAGFWSEASTQLYPPPTPIIEGKRPTGELSNYWDVMRPMRRLFAKLPIDQFGPAQLKAVRDWMIQPREERDPDTGQVRKLKGWSRRVVNRQVGRVRRIFAWGKEQGVVSDAAYFALQALKPLRPGRSIARETEPIGPIADEIVAATLPYLGRQLAAMVQLQQLTGMRPGEVVTMTTGQLERRADVAIYKPRKHKTAHHGKKRRIVLGKRAQELLNGFYRLDPDAPLFSPREAELERLTAGAATDAQLAAVDARRVGRSYTVRAYARAVSRACKRAKVEHWHPNQLRHSLATRIRSIDGLGLDAAQAVLGHATSKMTEVYAELRTDELAAKVARAIG